MARRSAEIQKMFEAMLGTFLHWDGVHQLDSVDRALLRTEANSLYEISRDIDKNLRSRFIMTAKGEDLDIIGEGMNRPRLGGETDDDYRKRLIINDTFFNDSTVQGLKNAIRGYYGVDIDNDGNDETKIVELYKTALNGGSPYNKEIKFLGEEPQDRDVVPGAIEVHLLMRQEGDEVIISREELFEKLYRTRAAGILLYLYFHGTFEDVYKQKLTDSLSLIGRHSDDIVGDSDRKVVKDPWKQGMPKLIRSDVFDARTKGKPKDRDYELLIGTDAGAARTDYQDNIGTEDNAAGKRYEDEVSHGYMYSRRVHRLLDGEKFVLPKDFQTPMRVGQRPRISLYNHTDNDTKDIMRVESQTSRDIRLRLDDGTNGLKATLQVVPLEFNGEDIVYIDGAILTDDMMSGKWQDINERRLIEDADIELYYDEDLDEYATSGYYISPPIHLDNITRFGMVKWVYDVGGVTVQLRTGPTAAYLEGLADSSGWGNHYSTNTGEFVQESVDDYFQFRINLTGSIYESPIFRLREFFVEYWDIPLSEIEEFYDGLVIGQDLIDGLATSVIGQAHIYPANPNGNGGSNPTLDLQHCQWLTNVTPVRQPRIRNRRWTLFYGVKYIITEYFTREAVHKYEREVVCL